MSRARFGALAGILLAACYSAVMDPGAALPTDVAYIRLVDQSDSDRTSHLPLFPGMPESLQVQPYRANGTRITMIEGGATCVFQFIPSNIATVQPGADSLTKVVTAAVPPGASGVFEVTLQFPFDTVKKSFGPFDVLVH